MLVLRRPVSETTVTGSRTQQHDEMLPEESSGASAPRAGRQTGSDSAQRLNSLVAQPEVLETPN